MNLEAPAKINLFLRITGRRPDGYHSLRTVFLPVSLCDTLTFEKTEKPGLSLSVSDPSLANENNLAAKAYRALLAERRSLGGVLAGTGNEIRTDAGSGVRIRIEKRIPMGAGLGGGSTDAAAALLGLNELFSLGYSNAQLCVVGARIGADVPALVFGKPSFGEGIGEILRPVPVKISLPLVIWKPQESYSTPEMYRRWDALPEEKRPDPAMEEEKERLLLAGLAEGNAGKVCEGLYNAFEAVVPDTASLKKSKALMYEAGLMGALLTGSGSGIFGIADSPAAAEQAAEHLRRKVPTEDQIIVCRGMCA